MAHLHVWIEARYGTLLQDLSAPKVESDPHCGLLQNKEVDTIRALQRRPRLGPQQKPEEL